MSSAIIKNACKKRITKLRLTDKNFMLKSKMHIRRLDNSFLPCLQWWAIHSVHKATVYHQSRLSTFKQKTTTLCNKLKERLSSHAWSQTFLITEAIVKCQRCKPQGDQISKSRSLQMPFLGKYNKQKHFFHIYLLNSNAYSLLHKHEKKN